jgi:hypothetical protein
VQEEATHVGLGFIDWAKKQIVLYTDMFKKQVFSSDVDQPTIDEALKITHSQSRKVCGFIHALHPLIAIQLLQEFGLDFRYLLDDLLAQHPKPSIPQNMPTRLAISSIRVSSFLTLTFTRESSLDADIPSAPTVCL